MAKKLIEQLKAIPALKIECPNCQSEVAVKRLILFNMYEPYPPAARKIIAQRIEQARVAADELKMRIDKLSLDQKRRPLQIEAGAHASNFGKISEHILPAFATFPYKHEECRTLFNPVDYVIFQGLCNNGSVEAIKFVDAKTGGGRLTREQRQIESAIASGEVKHRVIPQ